MPAHHSTTAPQPTCEGQTSGKSTQPSAPRIIAHHLAWIIRHRTVFGLLLMALVPIAFAVFRLTWLADTPASSALDAKAATFVADPLPLVLHVTAAPLFAVLGALMFSKTLLARRPDLHRRLGRVAAVSGALAAMSGLWLTLSLYGADPTTPLRAAMRLLVGSSMLAAILAALFAIGLRRVPTHRAWMTRAYAIGLSESTQAMLLLASFLVLGTLTPGTVTLMIALGWTINLAIAEHHLRRTLRRRRAQRLSTPRLSAM